MTKTSKLIAPCNSKDKALWVLAAKSCGLNLTDWVNDTLNDAVQKMDFKPPQWMKFSNRVCQCLIDEGITRKQELIDLIDSETWSWRQIPNFSTKCYNELSEWRQQL